MSTFGGSAAPTATHLQITEEEELISRAWATCANDSLPQDHSDKLQARLHIENSPCKLEAIFEEDGNSRVRLIQESFDEAAIPHVLSQLRPKITPDLHGTFATVHQKEFESRFAECSHHLLEGLDWTHIIAAGGSILSCLQKDLEHEHSHADVDLFLITKEDNKAMELLKHIYDVVKVNVDKHAEEERYKRIDVLKTTRTITIKTSWKTFQVVTTLFESPLEVLVGFDVDCGCVATLDGKTAVTTKRGFLSLQKRYNLWLADLRPSVVAERRYQKRLLKYSKKGYAVLALNADWSTLPNLDGRKIQDTKGLVTLALMDRLATLYPSTETHSNHLFTSGIEECIHGGDSWCKTCHKRLPQSESKPDDRVNWIQPIEWLSKGVYQDIERGQHTRAMSLHVPLDFDRWAYVSKEGEPSGNEIPSDPSGPQHDSRDPLTIDKLPVFKKEYELSSQDGIEIPECHCGHVCTIKASKRAGPNHGRRFFCCRNSLTDSSCNFFQWEGSSLSFGELRALRLRDRVSLDEVTGGIEALTLDTSKLLFAIASCFKSGRITAAQRATLKEYVLSDSSADKEEEAEEGARDKLHFILESFASHQSLDQLGSQLSQFCSSVSTSVV